MTCDQRQSGERIDIENGPVREFAKLLIVGAAALRGLAAQHPGTNLLVDESLEKILEIASTLDAIGETLRAHSVC